MSYEYVIAETRGAVGLITLNRPEALNALCTPLVNEVNEVLDSFEADESIGAIVLTGTERAFAAGADIKEMQDKTWPDVHMENFITDGWERLAECRKPVIAAVSGFALGGGCELAMMCDIIIAADTARFGQPEVNLAVPPGAGGTQRLTRIVGKSKAMDMCLTGRFMDAEEAERSGLVTRIVPAQDLIDEAVKMAQAIAEKSRPNVVMIKELVNQAYETSLSEGIRMERWMFHASFGTPGQKEGMAAFIEKRKPKFN